MKLKALNPYLAAAGIAVAAFTLALPARAQIGIYIGAPPPPVRYEARPRIPGPGYVWVDGYYEPWQGRYRWHPGFWQQPPFAGAYWVHPHYDHYDRGWTLHQGYWAHEDHGGYNRDGYNNGDNHDRDDHDRGDRDRGGYHDDHPH